MSRRVDTLDLGLPTRRRLDTLAVEAPLEVRFDGRPAAVLMRTPGHDEELVRGFLFNEGVIREDSDICSMTRPETPPGPLEGNVLDVRFSSPLLGLVFERPFPSNASCGACGKRSIQCLEIAAPLVESSWAVESELLTTFPQRLRDAQTTFSLTGGVHACGLFTAGGDLVAVREDVGRHNALDKLIGWALHQGSLPLGDRLLLLSGRASYELIQKAVMASIPIVAAVGAPSSLAVDLAQQFGITLVGFLRPDGMNIYANPARILPPGS